MKWLTEEEMYALTKKLRPKAQCRVLDEAGVPYTFVAGRPVVMVVDLCKGPNVKRPKPEPKLRLEPFVPQKPGRPRKKPS